MSIKKLSRVVIAALALTLVLAVSSFAAYSLTLEGTVAGLEDGVTYTAAKYDFENNTYGEFTELTDETVLTSGVWGIKAGDAEPTAFFVQGADSGKFNFWDAENEKVSDTFFKTNKLTDSYVPGFWSASNDGAFVNVTYYADYPSICVHLQKSSFLQKAEGATTWEGATPIEGENNLLAESEYLYGFTNNQVVPVSAFDKYASKQLAIKVGSVAYNEGHSEADLGSQVVLYTKTIGSDVVEEVVLDTTLASSKFTATLTANAPANAYIVGIGFRPYAGAPDDIFVNNGNNNEDRGYYHHWMNASLDNGLTLKELAFDGPTGLTGGTLTVEGLNEDKFYEWAPVTLNGAGDGYAIGEWQTLTEETEVAGLVVVRFVSENGVFASNPSDIIYVSGKATDRKEIGNFKDNGYVECKSGSSEWVVGYFAGNSAGQQGEGGAIKNYNSLDQAVSAPANEQTLWLYDHTEESAKALVEAQAGNTYAAWTGGSKPETMLAIITDFYASKKDLSAEEYAAERLAAAEKVVNAFEGRNHRYAYDNTEIVPVDGVSSFSFFVRKRQGSLIFTASSKVVFKVMDLEGNVTDYTYISPAKAHVNGGDNGYTKYDVDLTELFADAEGYLVGFAIYPFGEVDIETVSVADGQLLAAANTSARFIQNQAEQGWYPEYYGIEIPEYPALTGVVGAYGKLGGLKADGEYQYAYLTLNGTGTALVADSWTAYTEDTTLAGLVTVREVTRDGGYTLGSAPVYVYGSKDVRLDLGQRADNDTYLFVSLGDTEATPKFNVGKWTGRQLATNISAFGGVNGFGSYGSGWINANFSVAVKNAEAALAAATTDEEKAAAQATLDAAKQKLVDRAIKNYVTYTYTSDEIVPINEVEQFAFNTWKRMGSATYNGNVYSTVDVYVANVDGTITTHRYTTEAVALNTKRTVDFTNVSAWTPALPTEGWLVALSVDQWAGMTDFTKFTVDNNGYNTMPNFVVNPADYKLSDPKLVLPPVAADLSGLYEEDGIIKGLDANKSYEYAVANVNGIDAYLAIEEGATQFTPEKAGLFAIRVAGNGVTTDSSLPQVVLVPGDRRGDILHTTEMVGTGGKYNGVTINVLDIKNVGGFNLENRKNPTYNEYYWTGMSIDNALALNYGYDPLIMGGTGCTVYITGLKAAIEKVDGLKAAETPDEAAIAAAEAELLAIEKGIVEKTNDVWYTYQYGADEIIPMEDFVSITLKPWARQSGYVLAAGSYQTKFVFKVITENGELVDRVAYKTNAYGNSVGTQQTYTLSDFDETDGYIVGIIVYPYGKASDDIRVKVNPTYPAGNVASDINITLYTDGYKVMAPAVAPEATISAAIGGVNVHVTNAIEGATYAYSLDNVTWTNAPKALSTFTVVGAKDVVYVKMLDYGSYLESPVSAITLPAYKDAPELVLGEGNVLTAEAGIYEIAQYVFGTELTYEALTEKTLTTGVWAVRTIGDETAGASAPQIFYVAGEDVGTINYTAANGTSFVEGKWTMPYFTTMYKSGTDWATGIAEIHLNGVPYKQAGRREFALRYQFTQDEIVPVTELTDISSAAAAFYHGYIKEGYTAADTSGARAVSTHGQTLARVYVAGAAVPYYDIITEITYSKGYNFAISEYLADKEGYVVALELYPLWSIYGADNATDLGDDCITALWLTSITTPAWSDYTYKLRFSNQFVENELPEGDALPTANNWYSCLYSDGTNRFALKLEKVTPEAPTLTIDIKSQITITDYVASYKYQCSTDGGETWVDITEKTFNASKANTEYLVKITESGNSHASEASAITSQPVTVVGSSLVLDGQIATKIYFDIDEEIVKLDTVTFHATKVNSDYTDSELNRQYGYTNMSANSRDWMSKLTYDEARDLYYVIVSIPAKDADNSTLETELNYYLADGETKVVYGSVGYNFKVTSYIASAKALAEAGNEEFVAALDLINNLENYLTYADAYFSDKTVDEYKTDATIDVEAATRTNATLEGVEFYGTSLILEDNVTIRHYFKVNDIDAFVAAGYTGDIDFGTKGDYIYYDITDIAAQNLGEAYALTIKDAEGTVVYEVKYAATNYIAAMANDSNANLASLVNAMYDYYLAAVDYAK